MSKRIPYEQRVKKFLEVNNLESLDDVPTCPMCGIRKCKINVYSGHIYKTCCEPGCAYPKYDSEGRIMNKEYHLERFLKKYNFKSLDDVPICPICKTRKRHIDIKHLAIHSTCWEPDCKTMLTAMKRTPEQKLNKFLRIYGLKSLDDVPMCPICKTKKRKVNLERPRLYVTCGSEECYREYKIKIQGPKVYQTQLKRGNYVKICDKMTHEQRSAAAKKANATKARNTMMHPGYYTKFSGGTSRVEKQCYEFLKENFDDELESQYTLGDPDTGKFKVYDMYSKKHHLLIEFDGDYWHSLEDAIENDRYKEQLASRYGYNIYRIQEHSFYESEQDVLAGLNDLCIKEGI